MHSGAVVGKLEGNRDATLGWIESLRDSFIKEDRLRGVLFDQNWGLMPDVIPVASGDIHVCLLDFDNFVQSAGTVMIIHRGKAV